MERAGQRYKIYKIEFSLFCLVQKYLEFDTTEMKESHQPLPSMITGMFYTSMKMVRAVFGIGQENFKMMEALTGLHIIT